MEVRSGTGQMAKWPTTSTSLKKAEGNLSSSFVKTHALGGSYDSEKHSQGPVVAPAESHSACRVSLFPLAVTLPCRHRYCTDHQ